jgi:hypothetical protein
MIAGNRGPSPIFRYCAAIRLKESTDLGAQYGVGLRYVLGALELPAINGYFWCEPQSFLNKRLIADEQSVP